MDISSKQHNPSGLTRLLVVLPGDSSGRLHGSKGHMSYKCAFVKYTPSSYLYSVVQSTLVRVSGATVFGALWRLKIDTVCYTSFRPSITTQKGVAPAFTRHLPARFRWAWMEDNCMSVMRFPWDPTNKIIRANITLSSLSSSSQSTGLAAIDEVVQGRLTVTVVLFC